MPKINRRNFLGRISVTTAGLVILQSGCAVKSPRNAPGGGASAGPSGDEVAGGFNVPPFDCGPWVYWFWLDVNVTREGITADLEAMKAVGIAGVLLMDVDQGTPASFQGARFGDSKWYELFQFACAEASRLGMQVNLTNAAGWCGSGGPWVTPERSMQVVVWSSTSIVGGRRLDTQLPRPEARLDFYRDIAVLAFPTSAADQAGHGYRLPDFRGLTEGNGNHGWGAEDNFATRLHWENIPADQRISKSAILDLTGKMDEHGRLHGDLPAGGWTILRFGHTTTGMTNHPAPVGGLGLETDKLSRAVTLFHFDALMERMIKNAGPAAGQSLVATHIDSWETGSQNWTPTMRDDFKRLRGYDLLPYLPVLTGQVVDSLEISQRFLWDFRKTIGDLLLENYAAAMREAAQKHGLRLSIEGYCGEPAGDVCYGGAAVEPMAECWSWLRFEQRGTVTEMASAGHVYGRNIIGQETFTATADEKWLGHPAVVKDIGDWTFCEGINRFVFHRYAMQPWTNPHYSPGMCMGPWGMHYERTQTWWNLSKPWHDYVARCCHMLRQGHFVADVCYLEAEGAPRRFSPLDVPPRPAPDSATYPFPPQKGPGHPPGRPGYNYDICPPELVLEHMRFEGGHLTLPGGMRYRVLVLPDSPTITPELLEKIKVLVDAGARVIGPKPGKSPSLSHYPHCDDAVQKLADELWDSGKIISGKTPAEVLAAQGIKPDFECDQPLVRWIHRRTDDLDIYFVANGAVAESYPFAGRPMVANCSFRIDGIQPEFWDPETGRTAPVALYDTSGGVTRVPIVLNAKASVFVVFRKGQSHAPGQAVRSVSRNGKTILMAGGGQTQPAIEILSARYGAPAEPEHLRDATADVQKLVNNGETRFPVVKIAALGGDPATNVVKTLTIRYRVNDQEAQASFHDGDLVDFSVPGGLPPASVEASPDGSVQVCVTEPGNYECVLSSGKTAAVAVPAIPEPIIIRGPWTVKFPEGWGAPPQIEMETLIPLDQHSDPGVQYFSGTALYHCEFKVPAERLTAGRRIELDLGVVAVMAEVTLNGRRLGILWKPPFQIDVTPVLRAGNNSLQIAVANLWVNRLIGDQQLAPDAERKPNGALKTWPQWLLEGKPSPTGRFTFATWEQWHKNDPLVDSGLIGPVRLRTAVCLPRLAGKTGPAPAL